jgi:hypothetical protein
MSTAMERAPVGDRWAYGQPHQRFMSARRPRWATVLVTLFACMALAATPIADNVVNDVASDGGGGVGSVREIPQGGSTTVNYWINATNAGGLSDATQAMARLRPSASSSPRR